MKKFILIAVLGIAAAMYQPANAQISVNINIGSQPQWGPRGYNYVDYYYLPEIQSYYHVPSKKFIYLDGRKWVHRKNLPSMYRNYNLYQGKKIVINNPKPYLQHQVYQTRYSYRPVRGRQEVIRYDQRNYDRYDKQDHKKYKNNGRGRH